MATEEAVSLVLTAATITEGNDLFMLEMGEEILILDLARRMIRLRGLRPQVDIPIVYTGIRPGERIRERLLGATETRIATGQPGVFRVRSSLDVEVNSPSFCLEQLEAYVLAYDDEAAVRWLRTLVPQISQAVSPDLEALTHDARHSL
jgi:O-antigen biosynthesis protein WbqV